MFASKLSLSRSKPNPNITVALFHADPGVLPVLGKVKDGGSGLEFDVPKSFSEDFELQFTHWAHVSIESGVVPNNAASSLPKSDEYVALYKRGETEPFTVGFATYWNTNEFGGFVDCFGDDEDCTDVTHWIRLGGESSGSSDLGAHSGVLDGVLNDGLIQRIYVSDQGFNRCEVVRVAEIYAGVSPLRLGRCKLVNSDTLEEKSAKVLSCELHKIRYLTSKHAEYAGFASRHAMVQRLQSTHGVNADQDYSVIVFVAEAKS